MVPSCVVDSFLPPCSLRPSAFYHLCGQLGFQVARVFGFALTSNAVYEIL